MMSYDGAAADVPKQLFCLISDSLLGLTDPTAGIERAQLNLAYFVAFELSLYYAFYLAVRFMRDSYLVMGDIFGLF